MTATTTTELIHLHPRNDPMNKPMNATYEQIGPYRKPSPGPLPKNARFLTIFADDPTRKYLKEPRRARERRHEREQEEEDRAWLRRVEEEYAEDADQEDPEE